MPATAQDVAILTDDQLLVMLNQCKARAKPEPREDFDRQLLHRSFTVGIDSLEQALSSLGLPFKHPDYQPLSLLWPALARHQVRYPDPALGHTHDGSANSFASLIWLLDPTAISDPEDYTRADLDRKDMFDRPRHRRGRPPSCSGHRQPAPSR